MLWKLALAKWSPALMSDWWDDINESTEWQDSIFYTLCAAYALVSAVALIQLIRIELRVPEYGWTTQKVFHFMNFIVNGGSYLNFVGPSRAFVFLNLHFACPILGRNIPSGKIDFLVFLTRHEHARSLPTDKLRGVYIWVNCAIYFVQVIIWIYLWIDDNSVVESIGDIFIAVISIGAAVGFLLYGGRQVLLHCDIAWELGKKLFFMLRRFPIESKGRRKKLNEVGSVTAICCTCFVIRCFMDLLSAFDTDATLDVLDHPILNLIYYLLVEIIPSALVLYILKKLPPKRVSAQYHPIR
ncbi:THH1/TOM1/TOM3 domain [Dillenia turbinata]|uniref:THH1/TOM1/TOM3 domain n=1 Tax=Dillenia turbinata TaxID=194707 RepID=A0AAN8W6I3_9MAGN